MGDGSKDKILEQYSHLIKELDSRDIGYIQLVRYSPDYDLAGRGTQVDIQEFRPLIKNALFFANSGFTGEEGDEYIADGKADAITYGRPYIINPNLHSRLFSGTALNEQYDYTTFYKSPEDQPGLGYTSYAAAQS
ncbi:hypothetical protein CONCODRAFT_37571 [Conidiobolus coronatus NRRL 28638]|uniref:NADH:flavin oxidoreductase/NADH oxidase N-terminal domain-containing protein n=1 Tax=Conidiobolus coronatus (strain ATCC 28846 / CBS 209.66 / NRRL 28638) TaxID=796925 RepID=A0A137PAS0_CONC2|nr:hypothetical protein CONCODRAFT_37571 [Conidiobolus coronatus NRRL 28638]|eukprot:KXN72032.1 hypothetical protein CONCODRAFT_37571 [Conidiobolus coronatus NRRL 28638]